MASRPVACYERPPLAYSPTKTSAVPTVIKPMLRALPVCPAVQPHSDPHHDEASQGQDVHAEQDFFSIPPLPWRRRCYRARGVLCSRVPTRGSGSSSRTRNTPPAVSTVVTKRRCGTSALASVVSAIERWTQPQFRTVGKRRIARYAVCERSEISKSRLWGERVKRPARRARDHRPLDELHQ